MNGESTVRRLALFLSHGDEASLGLAGSCALAAAAMGDRVEVYLLGPAVRSVVEALPEPSDTPCARLYEARRAGECRLIGCSASVLEAKVPLDEAGRALDAIVGWPTILEWSRGVTDRFFF